VRVQIPRRECNVPKSSKRSGCNHARSSAAPTRAANAGDFVCCNGLKLFANPPAQSLLVRIADAAGISRSQNDLGAPTNSSAARSESSAPPRASALEQFFARVEQRCPRTAGYGPSFTFHNSPGNGNPRNSGMPWRTLVVVPSKDRPPSCSKRPVPLDRPRAFFHMKPNVAGPWKVSGRSPRLQSRRSALETKIRRPFHSNETCSSRVLQSRALGSARGLARRRRCMTVEERGSRSTNRILISREGECQVIRAAKCRLVVGFSPAESFFADADERAKRYTQAVSLELRGLIRWEAVCAFTTASSASTFSAATDGQPDADGCVVVHRARSATVMPSCRKLGAFARRNRWELDLLVLFAASMKTRLVVLLVSN